MNRTGAFPNLPSYVAIEPTFLLNDYPTQHTLIIHGFGYDNLPTLIDFFVHPIGAALRIYRILKTYNLPSFIVITQLSADV